MYVDIFKVYANILKIYANKFKVYADIFKVYANRFKVCALQVNQLQRTRERERSLAEAKKKVQEKKDLFRSAWQ